MKSILETVVGIMALSAGAVSVQAEDYSALSDEQLVQQRSQVQGMAFEERESYRTEMQSRMQAMSSEEQALFREMNNMGGQGEGNGKMNRYGQGSGNGSGNMYRYGQGENSGSGNMHRYGQSNTQGYGSGYGSRQGGGRSNRM